MANNYLGRQRAAVAQNFLESALADMNHTLFTAHDHVIAKQFNISRLTVINIRKRLSIKPRKDRVVELLKSIETSRYTLKELSAKLGLKYQNLYQIVRLLNLKTRPDVRPIVRLVEFQRRRRLENSVR